MQTAPELQRTYAQRLLSSEEHHNALVTDGYFVAEVLSEQELQELQAGYQHFLSLIEGEKLNYFAASCNVANREAVRYSKELIDRIFKQAFNRMFIEGSFEHTGGVFMMKKSGEDTYHPLHRDIPVVDERRTYGIYSWTPITETGPDSGRMFVVPGSNHSGSHQRSHLLEYPKMDEGLYRDSYKVLDVKMGETLFFDARLLHGSQANTSGKTRAVVNFYVKPAHEPCIYYAQNPNDSGLVDVYEIDPAYFFEQEHHGNTAKGKHMRFLHSEPRLA
jgi:hypothetical protein